MVGDAERNDALHRFLAVRQQSCLLCEPLAVEDMGVQPMDDASPPKWHLAHTTWFFETFILKAFVPGYTVFHEAFEYLFNSYYQGVGEPYPRPRRGLLSRPTVAEIYRYRAHVDAAMVELLRRTPELENDLEDGREVLQRVRLGCHHEQQHQELILTDLKYNLGTNPLFPAYDTRAIDRQRVLGQGYGPTLDAGIYQVGAVGNDFCFDNETPRHKALVGAFALSNRLVTNGEYLEFMAAGGYRRPEFWLSEGWATVTRENWQAPLYWHRADSRWYRYSLEGRVPVKEDEALCHVSFFEADAYARWRGKRLPSEFEWEIAAGAAGDGLAQLYGVAWQWTASAYSPYPGFQPLDGTLGEYNGKFMNSQMVLRGSSCATPTAHSRPTYRNFFYPADRWQFTGIRLAEDR